jgi:hypothetical protein
LRRIKQQGCLGIYSGVNTFNDDAIMPVDYGGLKTGRRR